MPALFTRTFCLLLTGQLLQNLAFASLPLLPLYLASLGADRTEIGVLMAAGAVGGILLRPGVGWALDVLGRRRVLVIATWWTSLSMISLWWITSTGWALFLSRVAFGVGFGALATAYFTLAADITPLSRRTEGIALFGIAGLLGLLVNPLAGTLGLQGEEMRWFLPLLGLFVMASLIPIRFLPVVTGAARPAPATPRTTGALLRALLARPLLPVWLATAVFGILLSAFLFFGSLAAEARGIERPTHLWFTYAGGAILVRIAGARLPDRLGPVRLVAPSLLFYLAGLVVAALGTALDHFLLAGLLAGFGHGYFFPVLASLAVSRAPEEVRGSTIAAFTGLLELMGLLAGPLLGWIGDQSDDRTLFLTAAAIRTAGLLLWLPLERRSQPKNRRRSDG